jgi:hypothetical protein
MHMRFARIPRTDENRLESKSDWVYWTMVLEIPWYLPATIAPGEPHHQHKEYPSKVL